MTRVVLWTTTLIATAGGFVGGVTTGRLVLDWPTEVLVGLTIALLTLAVVLTAFEDWLTRSDRRSAKVHERVTRAHRWETQALSSQTKCNTCLGCCHGTLLLTSHH